MENTKIAADKNIVIAGLTTVKSDLAEQIQPKRLPRLNLNWQEWSYPIIVFLVWRIGLNILAFLFSTFKPGLAEHNGLAPFNFQQLDFWGEKLLGVWSHWDGEWFLHIAQSGYTTNEASTAYFPLYPLLINILGNLFGKNYLLAGVLLSALSAAITFCLLYQLVKFEFGISTAKKAVLYLAVFPTSFYMAAIYSESLLLALALGAFLAVRQYKNWWLAGCLIGLAALTRNVGILLILPLGWEWLRYHFFTSPAEEQETKPLKLAKVLFKKAFLNLLALTALPVLIFALWPLYQLYIFGNPLRFVSAQSNVRWGRGFAWPWEAIYRALRLQFWDSAARPADFNATISLMQLGFWCFNLLILGLAARQVVLRKLQLSYLIFLVIISILPLFAPASSEPLLSFSRCILVGFPMYIVLAQLGQRYRTVHRAYIVPSIVLTILFFVLFAGWYWVS